MGYVLIDHSAGQGLDGKAGVKQEFDSCPCKHCGAVIAILRRPLGQELHLSSIDVGKASLVAKDLSEAYVGKRRCVKCKGNLCRRCHLAQPYCVTLAEQLDLLHEAGERALKG